MIQFGWKTGLIIMRDWGEEQRGVCRRGTPPRSSSWIGRAPLAAVNKSTLLYQGMRLVFFSEESLFIALHHGVWRHFLCYRRMATGTLLVLFNTTYSSAFLDKKVLKRRSIIILQNKSARMLFWLEKYLETMKFMRQFSSLRPRVNSGI